MSIRCEVGDFALWIIQHPIEESFRLNPPHITHVDSPRHRIEHYHEHIHIFVSVFPLFFFPFLRSFYSLQQKPVLIRMSDTEKYEHHHPLNRWSPISLRASGGGRYTTNYHHEPRYFTWSNALHYYRPKSPRELLFFRWIFPSLPNIVRLDFDFFFHFSESVCVLLHAAVFWNLYSFYFYLFEFLDWLTHGKWLHEFRHAPVSWNRFFFFIK